MIKNTVFLFVLICFSSCSTSVVREVAQVSSDKSCMGLANDLLKNNPEIKVMENVLLDSKGITSNPLVDKKLIEPSFTKLMLKRNELKLKYENVIESIKDFDPFADKAILGKAKLLIEPRDAYLAKIMMIRKARYSLDISYYIFHNDESGKFLLHEVRKAIKRGVKVRIMFDSLGTISSAPFYNELKALGALRGGKVRNLAGELTEERAKAEIVIINPMFNIRKHVSNWYNAIRNLFVGENNKRPLTTFSMNRRSHDKIIMTDAHSPDYSMAIIGGRNIANYYYALDPDGKTTFQDIEIFMKNIAQSGVEGNIENSLEDYYNKVFYYTANKNLENFIFKINRDTARSEFKKMRGGAQKLLSNPEIEAGLATMEKDKFLDSDMEEGMISLVHELQNFSRTKALLKPHHKENPVNGDSLVTQLREAMKKGKSSIEIVSPYLWLSDDDITFLKNWLKADPKRVLKVISNSISTTDNIPAQAMVDTVLGPKLVTEMKGDSIAKQIKVYAYGRLDDQAVGGNIAYGKLHAKFALIDDEVLLVGTSNLDPRSRYLNSELGVFFKGKDGKSSKELNAFFDDLVSKSYEWGSDDWKALREHKNNKISLKLQYFVGKIIHFFNLIPLI